MKNCSYCHDTLTDEGKCKNCTDNNVKKKVINTSNRKYKIVSIEHFIILNLATLSIYNFYWLYKAWVYLKDKE